MKIELATYKSARSKEALTRIEVTKEELEYLFGLIDREFALSDALYGLSSGTRKERSLMKKVHEKIHNILESYER